MARWRGKMERKQGFLGRVVDIGAELFAMAATCVRARSEADPAGRELAELFCQQSRRRIEALFTALWDNTDALDARVAKRVTEGQYPRQLVHRVLFRPARVGDGPGGVGGPRERFGQRVAGDGYPVHLRTRVGETVGHAVAGTGELLSGHRQGADQVVELDREPDPEPEPGGDAQGRDERPRPPA